MAPEDVYSQLNMFGHPAYPSMQDIMDASRANMTGPEAGAQAAQQAGVSPPPSGPAATNAGIQQSVQATQTPPPDAKGGKGKQEDPQEMLNKAMGILNEKLGTGTKGKGIGGDLLGEQGGILGSGISPLSAILFGLGAVATRKAPKETAWNVSMKLAGLPQQYQKAQDDATNSTIRTALETLKGARDQHEQATRDAEDEAMKKAGLDLPSLLGGLNQQQPQPGQAPSPPPQQISQAGPVDQSIQQAGISPEQAAQIGGPTLAQSAGGGSTPQPDQATTQPQGLQAATTSARQRGVLLPTQSFGIVTSGTGRPHLGIVNTPATSQGLSVPELKATYPDLSFGPGEGEAIAKLPPSVQQGVINHKIARIDKAAHDAETINESKKLDIFAQAPVDKGGIGKPFAEGNNTERAKVLQDYISAQAGARAGGAVAGKAAAEQLVPLGSKSVNFLNQKGEMAPRDMTAANALEKGFVEFSPQESRAVRDNLPIIKSAMADLDKAEKTIKAIYKPEGILNNIQQRIELTTARAGGGSEIKNLDAAKARLLPQLTKVIERLPGSRLGVRMIGIEAPQVWEDGDSAKSALEKIDTIRERLSLAPGGNKDFANAATPSPSTPTLGGPPPNATIRRFNSKTGKLE